MSATVISMEDFNAANTQQQGTQYAAFFKVVVA